MERYVDLITCSINRKVRRFTTEGFHTKCFLYVVSLQRKIKDRTQGIGKTRISFSKLSLTLSLKKCRKKQQVDGVKLLDSREVLGFLVHMASVA